MSDPTDDLDDEPLDDDVDVVNDTDDIPEIHLIHAIDAGDESQVMTILQDGVDVDWVDEGGETCLHHACRMGSLSIIQQLILHADATIDATTSNGTTPIMIAVQYGHSDVVIWLIQHGADVSVRNENGHTIYDIIPIKGTHDEMLTAITHGLNTRNTSIQEEKTSTSTSSSMVEQKYASVDVVDEDDDMDESEHGLMKKKNIPIVTPTPTTLFDTHTPVEPTPIIKPTITSSAPDPIDMNMNDAIISLITSYRTACKDVECEPNAFIIEAMEKLKMRSSFLILNLSGTLRTTPDRVTDLQLFPLTDILSHGWASHTIHTIDLSFNRVGNSGCKAIAAYLTHTQCLRDLNLSANDIGVAGIEHLAQALTIQRTLRRLNLESNPIGAATSKLAEMLNVNTTLTDLNMKNTEMNALCIIQFSVALRTNQTLSQLNLDNPLLTSVQEESTIHLARALCENHSITRLSLGGHRMTDHGVDWIATYLSKNHTINYLDLSRNSITSDGVLSLARSISSRPLSCHVKLDNNLLKGQPITEIQSSIDALKSKSRITYESDISKQNLIVTV